MAEILIEKSRQKVNGGNIDRGIERERERERE